MRTARRLVAGVVTLLAATGVPYVVYAAWAALTDTSDLPLDRGDWEPAVSVVVPTYNEAEIVESKLKSVCALDYPAEKLEVVVADASDDDTPAVVERFFADREVPSLTLRHDDERRGVAAALNDAFAAASGEVILRTDADSRLARDVLRHAVADLADPTVGVVTGQQTEILGESSVEADYRGILARLQAFESRLNSTFIVHGPCFAFRREDFTPVSPDTLADDTALALQIRRTGKRVVMDPGMRFVESGASAFRERRLRKDRRAAGLVQLLVRNRDMLGSHGWFGWVVLPFNVWFMLVSPWLLAASAVLATVAFAVVSGPLALAVPFSAVGLFVLGGRELLGPLQPLYVVLDAQFSLLVGAVSLLTDDGSGTWELDRESREVFRE